MVQESLFGESWVGASLSPNRTGNLLGWSGRYLGMLVISKLAWSVPSGGTSYSFVLPTLHSAGMGSNRDRRYASVGVLSGLPSFGSYGTTLSPFVMMRMRCLPTTAPSMPSSVFKTNRPFSSV